MKPIFVLLNFSVGFFLCFVPIIIHLNYDDGTVDGMSKFSQSMSSKFYCYANVMVLVNLAPILIDHLIDCTLPTLFSAYGNVERPINKTFFIILVFGTTLLQLAIFIPSNNVEVIACTFFARHLLQYFIGFMRLWMFAESLNVQGQPYFIMISFLMFTLATLLQCGSLFVGISSIYLVYVSIFLSILCIVIICLLCYICLTKIRVKIWREMSMFERDGYILIVVLPLVLILNCLIYVIYMGTYTAEHLGLSLYIFQIIPTSRALFEKRNILTEATLKQSILTTKRNFVRMVSHEIRTPLNVVSAGLDLMKIELLRCRCHPEALDTWNDVRSSNGMAVSILDELLTYEKLESGVMQLDVEKISVWPFVRDCVRGFNIQAVHKGLTLRFDKDEDELAIALAPFCITADRSKLSQVIRNFVSNAIKFTSAGGDVTVTVEILDDIRAGNVAEACKALRVSVKDSGVGISKENLPKLFDQVIQFNPGKLQGGGGSGLGLWIAKRIMDLHMGHVAAHSEGVGFGCVFSFQLSAYEDSLPSSKPTTTSVASGPNKAEHLATRSQSRVVPFSVDPLQSDSVSPTAATGKENSEPRQVAVTGPFFRSHGSIVTRINSISTQQPLVCFYCQRHFAAGPHPSSSQSKNGEQEAKIDTEIRILIVDDSPVNLKTLRRLLQTRFANVSVSGNGQEALTLVTQKMGMGQSFHFVLMDHQMPVMDGPTAVRAMRAAGYAGVVIGVSGNGLPEDQQEFLLSGANKILLKPVDSNSLFGLLLMQWSPDSS